MTAAVTAAPAKVNLSLVVGPLGADGKHEVATVLQRVGLADTVAVEPSARLEVAGFADDTLVARALQVLASAAGVEPRFRATIEKRIPVASGLAGGSSDAAAALRLANGLLPSPLPAAGLLALAAGLGADVPFFLEPGPQLGTGDGSRLAPLALPQDYHVVLLLPHGEEKPSTASVYRAFDEREGAEGYPQRRAALLAALERVAGPADLALLPGNDLASSPYAVALVEQGAFRADVSGAGPTVYGLFAGAVEARRAAAAIDGIGRVWVTSPTWYV